MLPLDKSLFGAAFDRYRTSEYFFPLIGAVLLDEQDGKAFADDPDHPDAIYVEHAFGFAQILGDPASQFERALREYLLVHRQFAPAKVRLYAPRVPSFLAAGDGKAQLSYRQRFVIDASVVAGLQAGAGAQHEITFSEVDEGNVSAMETKFGVVRRFWRSAEDFIRKANGIVVLHRGEPAAICYSAAEADGRTEIDVFTLPEYRGRGLARSAVRRYIERCRERSMQPLWDCFTNNQGSMQLCRSVGFVAAGPAYSFFTINK